MSSTPSPAPPCYRLSPEQHNMLTEGLRLCVGTLDFAESNAGENENQCPAGLVRDRLDALWDVLIGLEQIPAAEPAQKSGSQQQKIAKGFERGWLKKYQERDELQAEIVRLRECLESLKEEKCHVQ